MSNQKKLSYSELAYYQKVIEDYKLNFAIKTQINIFMEANPRTRDSMIFLSFVDSVNEKFSTAKELATSYLDHLKRVYSLQDTSTIDIITGEIFDEPSKPTSSQTTTTATAAAQSVFQRIPQASPHNNLYRDYSQRSGSC